jgi:hypothetical protein
MLADALEILPAMTSSLSFRVRIGSASGFAASLN